MNIVSDSNTLDHQRDIAISPDPNRSFQIILEGKDLYGNYKEEVIYVTSEAKEYISLFPYKECSLSIKMDGDQ